jgi:hypothetical protein
MQLFKTACIPNSRHLLKDVFSLQQHVHRIGRGLDSPAQSILERDVSVHRQVRALPLEQPVLRLLHN